MAKTSRLRKSAALKARRGATRMSAAATTRGRTRRSGSRPAASTRTGRRGQTVAAPVETQVDNSIPVKLSKKEKAEVMEKLRRERPKNIQAPLENPTTVLARLRAREPKPAYSKKSPGVLLDSTYPERRAAWEKAIAREQERERAVKAGVTPEENQRMASSSEHLVRRLGATRPASEGSSIRRTISSSPASPASKTSARTSRGRT